MSESTEAVRVWRSGPPPHIGWWNASTTGKRYRWRWWNGEHWSKPAHSDMRAETARWCAAGLSDPRLDAAMKWNDYWPKDARVPRIAP